MIKSFFSMLSFHNRFNFFFSLVLLLMISSVSAQVGVGTSDPDPSAMLHVNSTTKGMLVSRMTALQRQAIVSPADGLIVYQTDGLKGFYYNAGNSQIPEWVLLLNAGGDGSNLSNLNASNLTSGTVPLERMATGTPTSSTYLKGDGTWSVPSVAGTAGGDLSGSYPNPSIANNAITSAKISDGTIANADISTTAAIAYSKLSLSGSITSSDITDATITGSDIANTTIGVGKINATGTAGTTTFLRGDGSWSAPSLDGTAGGDLSGSYPSPSIAANAITSAKINDGTIVNADISTTAAIAYSKLSLSGSITSSDITDATITGTDIANTTIGIGKINATGTAGSTNYLRGDGSWSVPAAAGTAGGDLSGTYPSPTIAASAVTSAKIADGTIVGADIANTTIGVGKINATGTASSTTFLRGDGTWSAASVSSVQIRYIICVEGLFPAADGGSSMDAPFLGQISMYAGPAASIPANYRECKGQSLPVSTNQALYSIIGNTYGGNTTAFNLPNLTGVVAVGK